MRIIISPAKKMNVDTDSFSIADLPQFIESAELLRDTMNDMSDGELQALWRCNEKILQLNLKRLRTMNLRENLTPAVMSYEGLQYRYMGPGVMEKAHLEYIQEHLRILSGFYGILRPFDGVTPYRLEMQARLSVNRQKDLYAFWGNRLAKQLAEESEWIVNLASKEYSKAVEPWLPPDVHFLTCSFLQWDGDRFIEKGTLCKMARGQMVRWLAEHQIVAPGQIQAFADLGYRFDPERSTESHFVFLKGGFMDV